MTAGPGVHIPGGTFVVGTDDTTGFPDDGERPSRGVAVPSFVIGQTAVTNAEFASFVAATGHVTDAERYGWSFVFNGLIAAAATAATLPSPPDAPWWVAVPGATWSAPTGPGSGVEDRAEHPVVHTSWYDASAYCAWVGCRLPTEAEWEVAARGGLVGATFPWGDELTPGGVHRCNLFQGTFPSSDSGDDGWIGTAPVRSYPPNGYGLYEVIGNVWEWCSDWFSPTWHLDPRREACHHPHGPSNGTDRVIRGGSYLCHESYCNRYRVAARSANSPDSSTGNTGFRWARDVQERT